MFITSTKVFFLNYVNRKAFTNVFFLTLYTTLFVGSMKSSATGFREYRTRLRRHRADRKPRTPFSSDQLLCLEQTFHRQPYLSPAERAHYAAALRLTETQVRLRKKFVTIATVLINTRKKSFPSHKAHRAALISVSLALS